MANPKPLAAAFRIAHEAESAMDRLWWSVREATAELRKMGESEQADECERLAFFAAAHETRWWKTWRKALSRCAYPDGGEPLPKRVDPTATPKKKRPGRPRDPFAKTRTQPQEVTT